MINNDNPSGTRKRLDVDQRFIWRPDISGCGWKYSHHPFITIFKGMLFATFSSGIERRPAISAGYAVNFRRLYKLEFAGCII